MKKLILIISTIFILFSCNNNVELITITSENRIDSTYLPITDSIYNLLGHHAQIILINGKEYLMRQGYKYGSFSNEIHIIDIKKKTVFKKIKFNNFPKHGSLSDFYYLNQDSVFLFMDNGIHVDTALVMTNINGDKIKYFKTNNPYFTTKENSFEKDSSLIAFNFRSTVYYNNKIFFGTILYYSADFDTKKFNENKYPIVGYFDLEKDTVILNHDIWFPKNEIINYNYENSKYPYMSVSYNNNIIIGFANSHILYEWDIKTNNIIKKHSFKSQLFNNLIINDSLNIANNITPYYYVNLQYIDSLDMFVRDMFFSKGKYGDFTRLSIFADKNFNYIGEYQGFLLNFNNKNKDYSIKFENDSIKLVKRTLAFGKLDFVKIKDKLLKERQKQTDFKQEKFCNIMGNNFKFTGYSNKVMINYLQKLFNKKDSTFATFIITDNGCGPCNDYLLSFVRNNKQAVNNQGACLLLTGTNTKYLNNIISEYNLSDYSLLRIDTTLVYKELHPFDSFNPRMVLIRNNKIVSDTVYMPSDMQNLLMDYIEFGNFEIDKEKSKPN